ncbi:uncharacterized protein LOC131942223 [Physella acuta]|uniref:uncharacterized protein LOC131942223 n=1 Tax=Physella acuta TaxID=109671 RepID=UPI0027DD8706|nr:uncharacterized protein LOC131942223 [Physella acuta]
MDENMYENDTDGKQNDSIVTIEIGPHFTAVYVMLSIVLLSIAGNSLVLFSYLRDRRLQVMFNLFVMNLSVADIIISVFIILEILILFTNVNVLIGGSILCHMFAVVINAIPLEQLLIGHLMCSDRREAIQRRLKYGQRSQQCQAEALKLAITWAISFVTSFVLTNMMTIFRKSEFRYCFLPDRLLIISKLAYVYEIVLCWLLFSMLRLVHEFRKLRMRRPYIFRLFDMEPEFGRVSSTHSGELGSKLSSQSLIPRSPISLFRHEEPIIQSYAMKLRNVAPSVVPILEPQALCKTADLSSTHAEDAVQSGISKSSPKSLKFYSYQSIPRNRSEKCSGHVEEMEKVEKLDSSELKQFLLWNKEELQFFPHAKIVDPMCGVEIQNLNQLEENTVAGNGSLENSWSKPETESTLGKNQLRRSSIFERGKGESRKSVRIAELDESNKSLELDVDTVIPSECSPLNSSISEDYPTDIPLPRFKPRTDSLYTLKSCMSISEESLKDERTDPTDSLLIDAEHVDTTEPHAGRVKEYQHETKLFTIGDANEDELSQVGNLKTSPESTLVSSTNALADDSSQCSLIASIPTHEQSNESIESIHRESDPKINILNDDASGKVGTNLESTTIRREEVGEFLKDVSHAFVYGVLQAREAEVLEETVPESTSTAMPEGMSRPNTSLQQTPGSINLGEEITLQDTTPGVQTSDPASAVEGETGGVDTNNSAGPSSLTPDRYPRRQRQQNKPPLNGTHRVEESIHNKEVADAAKEWITFYNVRNVPKQYTIDSLALDVGLSGVETMASTSEIRSLSKLVADREASLLKSKVLEQISLSQLEHKEYDRIHFFKRKADETGLKRGCDEVQQAVDSWMEFYSIDPRKFSSRNVKRLADNHSCQTDPTGFEKSNIEDHKAPESFETNPSLDVEIDIHASFNGGSYEQRSVPERCGDAHDRNQPMELSACQETLDKFELKGDKNKRPLELSEICLQLKSSDDAILGESATFINEGNDKFSRHEGMMMQGEPDLGTQQHSGDRSAFVKSRPPCQPFEGDDWDQSFFFDRDLQLPLMFEVSSDGTIKEITSPDAQEDRVEHSEQAMISGDYKGASAQSLVNMQAKPTRTQKEILEKLSMGRRAYLAELGLYGEVIAGRLSLSEDMINTEECKVCPHCKEKGVDDTKEVTWRIPTEDVFLIDQMLMCDSDQGVHTNRTANNLLDGGGKSAVGRPKNNNQSSAFFITDIDDTFYALSNS